MVAIAAYESGVAMPLGNVAKEVYRLGMQQGLGRQDFSAIYSFLKAGIGKGDRFRQTRHRIAPKPTPFRGFLQW